ncbi:hypothetical protein, conserved [Eimeria tenella]|uniref:Hexosyltransferase n=1 Tax=Eimeria tenella TaxID=5802 RepID=U6KXD2_EIMTE|nr:hypothetical protein, conserved [Eimeria tenella]CDJ40984.1 hypothetical protein, conserved [Eimeria tenella]|eukprot:XP_013231734.1 hypothetical protein, conserved [Eimeria tenella]
MAPFLKISNMEAAVDGSPLESGERGDSPSEVYVHISPPHEQRKQPTNLNLRCPAKQPTPWWVVLRHVFYSLLFASALLIYLIVSRACSWEWDGEPQAPLLSLPLKTQWELLITPKVSCAKDPPFVALMAMTGPADFDGRQLVRNTWGGAEMVAERRVRLFFLLGTAPGVELQRLVAKEAEVYGDLIQHAAPDKYTNLSIKSATMIQWVATSCPEAKFVVKADTDTLVNLEVMVPYLKKMESKGDIALGVRLDRMPIITSEKHRNYQDPLVFSRPTFPPYLSGACYIVSGSLVQKLSTVLSQVPRVRNEDTFLGMCMEKLGIEPTNIAREAQISPWFDPSKGPCAAFRLAAAHPLKRDMLLAMWKWWKSGGSKMCH